MRPASRPYSCPVPRRARRVPRQPTLYYYWRNAGPWGSASDEPPTQWRWPRAGVGLTQKSELWTFWPQAVRNILVPWRWSSSWDQMQPNLVLHAEFSIWLLPAVKVSTAIIHVAVPRHRGRPGRSAGRSFRFQNYRRLSDGHGNGTDACSINKCKPTAPTRGSAFRRAWALSRNTAPRTNVWMQVPTYANPSLLNAPWPSPAVPRSPPGLHRKINWWEHSVKY